MKIPSANFRNKRINYMIFRFLTKKSFAEFFCYPAKIPWKWKCSSLEIVPMLCMTCKPGKGMEIWRFKSRIVSQSIDLTVHNQSNYFSNSAMLLRCADSLHCQILISARQFPYMTNLADGSF